MKTVKEANLSAGDLIYYYADTTVYEVIRKDDLDGSVICDAVDGEAEGVCIPADTFVKPVDEQGRSIPHWSIWFDREAEEIFMEVCRGLAQRGYQVRVDGTDYMMWRLDGTNEELWLLPLDEDGTPRDYNESIEYWPIKKLLDKGIYIY